MNIQPANASRLADHAKTFSPVRGAVSQPIAVKRVPMRSELGSFEQDAPATAGPRQSSAIRADGNIVWLTLVRPRELVRQSDTHAGGLPIAVSPMGLRKPSMSGRVLKRAADLAIAGSALVALAPLLASIAVLIRSTMGGPVIYAQERIGRNGKVFRCYKFRTMVADADERLRRYLAQNPEYAREWRENQKLAHDPRVTRIGHLLRKSSLDELPQLLNVLLGQMSCVGARPVVAAELERYGPHLGSYLAARPGMTGLWQVSGRSARSYAERVALDALYAQNQSFVLDIAILLRTIPAVLQFSDTA